MGLSTRYSAAEPSRAEVEKIAGPAVLESHLRFLRGGAAGDRQRLRQP